LRTQAELCARRRSKNNTTNQAFDLFITCPHLVLKKYDEASSRLTRNSFYQSHMGGDRAHEWFH
jgi:hypothetical protein